MSDEQRRAYREAYEDWHRKLLDVHAVLLDGKPAPGGDQMKGLLNREARAKARYDEARLGLLGIGTPGESPFGD